LARLVLGPLSNRAPFSCSAAPATAAAVVDAVVNDSVPTGRSGVSHDLRRKQTKEVGINRATDIATESAGVTHCRQFSI
jgi:hypothetical protein